jgi:hypothetical protein
MVVLIGYFEIRKTESVRGKKYRGGSQKIMTDRLPEKKGRITQSIFMRLNSNIYGKV